MTTASGIFNQFASAKNFSQAGNRITSTQPGKPFASAEAMNYIPVGYNTSGGNMFRYGSLAASVAKDFTSALGRKLTARDKALISQGLTSGQSRSEIASGLLGKAGKSNVSKGQQAWGSTRKGVQETRQESRKGAGGGTDIGEYLELRAQNKRLQPTASNKKARGKKNKANQQTIGANSARMGELRSGLDARSDAGLQKEVEKMVGRPQPSAEKGLIVHPTLSNNAKAARAAEAAKVVKNKVGGETGKLGSTFGASFSSHFDGLKDNQKNMLMAAGGIAALGAAGTAYGAITGSKRDPVGSAMTVGLAGAGLAAGYRGVGRHLMGSALTSMSLKAKGNAMKAMPAAIKNMSKGKIRSKAMRMHMMKNNSTYKMGRFMSGSSGVSSFGQAAMIGVGAGAVMGGVGMGRNITGI